MPNRRFNFRVNAYSLCVPSMYSILELLQNRKHLPSLLPSSDQRCTKLRLIVSHCFIHSWFTNTFQYCWIWHLSSRCFEIDFSSFSTLLELTHIAKVIFQCRRLRSFILTYLSLVFFRRFYDLLSLILCLVCWHSCIIAVFTWGCRAQVVAQIAQLSWSKFSSFLALFNYLLDSFFSWSSFLPLLCFWIIGNALFDIRS